MTLTHAIVLPDRDFEQWLEPVKLYMQAFERVAVLRSAGGNDLNRYHTITAVQAPMEWMDNNALTHIQRVFSQVVRVDVIPADTPDQLNAVLQRRIANNDRYGEQDTDPKHLFERFTLSWPSTSRPARILRDYKSGEHEGMDITASPGSEIVAGAAGQVVKVVNAMDELGYGLYVQVQSIVDGLVYITTYAGLMQIDVTQGAQVAEGDVLGKAGADRVKIVVQNPPNGASGMALNNVINPVNLIYWPDLRLRPTVRGLRVRSAAGTHGDELGLLTAGESVEPFDPPGRVLLALGVEDKWLRLRYAGKNEAYSAAWMMESYGGSDPVGKIAGVNLDVYHHLGAPDPAGLANLGYVRLLYNVSFNPDKHPSDVNLRYGNTDLNYTYNRYRPYLEKLKQAGVKTILVLNHQTFGEGAGYNWEQMHGRWGDLISKLVDMSRRIAEQYRGTGLVDAYQIWNEQDTPAEHARAAVPIPATEYAHLLAESIKAIKSADPAAKVITGGHVTGPGTGYTYAVNTMNALPAGVTPDGIAFHPYGQGDPSHEFTIHGSLSDAVRIWSKVLPGKPMWITEWGVLGIQGRDEFDARATSYAQSFLRILETEFPSQIVCACWYAYADTMDDGYGFVRENNTPRDNLYKSFLG